jgi:DNA invertase Pin-like site-specific DNA recombinase
LKDRKKAIGYGRISTEKQSEGISLEAQQEAIVTFGVASGYELIDVLVDDAISGAKTDDERPGLAAVLAAIQEGRASVVIACKRDRLARTQALCGYVQTLIEKAGAELVVIDEVALSDITRAVLTMVSEVERLLAIQRTKLAMRALKARGMALGNVPYGYFRADDGRFHQQADEMAVVSKIINLRRSGMTQKEIARQLRDDQIPTKRGGVWRQEQVRSILARNLPCLGSMPRQESSTEA